MSPSFLLTKEAHTLHPAVASRLCRIAKGAPMNGAMVAMERSHHPGAQWVGIMGSKVHEAELGIIGFRET